MTRIQALRALQFAGYHEDTKTLIRIRVEERVSYSAAREAFEVGKRMRERGMKCGCLDCNPGTKIMETVQR